MNVNEILEQMGFEFIDENNYRHSQWGIVYFREKTMKHIAITLVELGRQSKEKEIRKALGLNN